MATLAADNLTASADEARRAPAELTNMGGLILAGGAVLLFAAAAIARFTSGDDGNVMARFWHAYLLNASFAASLSIGGLFFVIAHHLTGGRWGTSLRRVAELVAKTIFFSAVLFVPIVLNVLLGSHDLYEWNDQAFTWNAPAGADPATLKTDPILEAKSPYLDSKWFAIRTAVYFGLWLAMASLFVGGSMKQDKTGKVAPLRRLSWWSGPSMLLFAMALNFASFDWLMSLAPHWFSTMFGVYYFAGSVIGFLSLLLLLAIALQSMGVLTKSVTTDNLHDVAKLLFAFVVFWGYITFSQFLLIWYANVPEETEWFGVRQLGQPTMFGIPGPLAWLFVLHLIVPFLGFMSRAVRRNKAAMAFWAGYLLVMHWLDLVLIVMPGTHGYEDRSAFAMIGFFEIACLVGVVAVILGALLKGAEGCWLLPLRDPRLKQSMTYHNH